MNLEQMKLAQSLGVKVQCRTKAGTSGDSSPWCDGGVSHACDCHDWKDYRIAPGQTFDGGVAEKLLAAGVELEWIKPGGICWRPQPTDSHAPYALDGLTYRIPESFGTLTEEKEEEKPNVFIVARAHYSINPTLQEAEDEAARMVAEWDGKAIVIEGKLVSEWVCDVTRRVL